MFKVSALLNVHCNAAVEQNIYSFNRDAQSTSNAWRYEQPASRNRNCAASLSHFTSFRNFFSYYYCPTLQPTAAFIFLHLALVFALELRTSHSSADVFLSFSVPSSLHVAMNALFLLYFPALSGYWTTWTSDLSSRHVTIWNPPCCPTYFASRFSPLAFPV
jgi:hypothetical protein